MIVVALVLASLALFVSLLSAAALVELYDRVRTGTVSEPVDRAVPVPLGEAAGNPPSAYGLPADLDERSSVILFLSPSCPACADLVQAFDRPLPEGLHFVVTAPSAEAAHEWAADAGLPLDRCTIDAGHGMIRDIGLGGTPVAAVVDAGRLSYATGVPSARWFSSLLQEVPA